MIREYQWNEERFAEISAIRAIKQKNVTSYSK